MGDDHKGPAPGQGTKEAVSLGRRNPGGSIGAAWQAGICTAEWDALALSSRTKIWWSAWEMRVEPVLGDMRPGTTTMAPMSEWRDSVAREFGLDAAQKAVKVWRSLWAFCSPPLHQLTDPSKKVTNTAPRPHNARLDSTPALRLARTAWWKSYRDLACIILVRWNTGFRLGAARTARARGLGTDPRNGRLVVDRSADGRDNMGAPLIGTLLRLGDALLRIHLFELSVEIVGEALLFRTRKNQPYRDTFLSHDFADIRAMMDPTGRRQLRDRLRSATMEAFRGGADSKAASQKFGDSIDRSAFLFRNYNPVDLDQVRQAGVRGRRNGDGA